MLIFWDPNQNGYFSYWPTLSHLNTHEYINYENCDIPYLTVISNSFICLFWRYVSEALMNSICGLCICRYNWSIMKISKCSSMRINWVRILGYWVRISRSSDFISTVTSTRLKEPGEYWSRDTYFMLFVTDFKRW